MQIRRGVPLPPYRRGGNFKYPWDGMALLDSFFVPRISIQAFSGTALRAARNRGWKVSCRSVRENGVAGVRVWRTE